MVVPSLRSSRTSACYSSDCWLQPEQLVLVCRRKSDVLNDTTWKTTHKMVMIPLIQVTTIFLQVHRTPEAIHPPFQTINNSSCKLHSSGRRRRIEHFILILKRSFRDDRVILRKPFCQLGYVGGGRNGFIQKLTCVYLSLTRKASHVFPSG